MTIEKIIKVSRKMGLGGVAIVDHNTIVGGLKGVSINKYDDFIVIPGSEITTDKGDILGLFLNEDIKPQAAFEVVDAIRQQGGVSILAHPYKRQKIDEELLRMVDGIEVFNARSTAHKNRLAQNLADKYNLPATAGSDAHFYFEIGRSFCVVDSNVLDEEAIRKSILTKKSRIVGNEVNPFVEVLSQTVRIIKTREPKAVLHTPINFARATYFMLKNIKGRF